MFTAALLIITLTCKQHACPQTTGGVSWDTSWNKKEENAETHFNVVTLKNVTLSERSIEDFVLHDSIHTNQPWIFAGRTDAKAVALVFWSPDVNSRLTGKVPDAGKD